MGSLLAAASAACGGFGRAGALSLGIVPRLAATCLALAIASCAAPAVPSDGRLVDAETPTFSEPTAVTNPLFPMGTVMQVVQLGEDQGQPLRVEVTLLPETRLIEWDGREVETIVSQFISYRDGRILEVAYDYFAQADGGAVWYFGEQVDNYADGRIANHGGAWLAGVDGPPGMIMPAEPRRNDVYHPENIPGVVYEEVIVLETDVTAPGPSGDVTGAIRVMEHLMEGSTEQKLFAPGYGEFRVEAPNEVVDVAIAVPTDARAEPLPDDLAEIAAAARRCFDAATTGEWSAAGDAAAQVASARDRLDATQIPDLLYEQLVTAADELSTVVENRDAAAAARALAVAHAAVDISLLYRDATAADLDRMELWARQVIVDAGRTAELRGDVAVLETIWNRAHHAVDPARAERIVTWLDEMRAAADDADLDAVVVSARSLSTELMEVLTDAG